MASPRARDATEQAGVEACEPPSGQILDGEAFLRRLEGDRPLARELLLLFEEHVPLQTDALRAAVAAGDASQIEAAAHGLKGVLNNIHAERAAQVAFRLEQMGRSRTVQEAGPVFDSLLQHMQQLTEALQVFRKERLS